MLLSLNSEMNGKDINLQAITEGSDVDSGVAHGQLLSRLVELTLDNTDNSDDSIATVRNQIVDAMSAEALVDASAIIGNFQRMVRIADGTGIPLDKPVAILSAGLRKKLGFNKFGSANLTPKVSAMTQWLATKLRPFIIKKMTAKPSQSS